MAEPFCSSRRTVIQRATNRFWKLTCDTHTAGVLGLGVSIDPRLGKLDRMSSGFRDMGHCNSNKWNGLAKLILGSKSWSRKTLLRELGVPEFSVMVADIDESAVTEETPQALVLSIGLAKARAILATKALEPVPESQGKTLLVCGDSVVTHKSQILGKPTSKDHARSICEATPLHPPRL